MRRFLDFNLPAGGGPVRADYRSRLPAAIAVPRADDLGSEAWAVGRTIDQRLRLAFTIDVPASGAIVDGVAECHLMAQITVGSRRRWWEAIAAAGDQVIQELGRMAADLALDDRRTPLTRSTAEEEPLARLLLLSAWFEVMIRAGVAGFEGTPIHRSARGTGGLRELLSVVPEPLVREAVDLVHAAQRSPLAALRADTQPADCVAGPLFDGSGGIGGADADLLVRGTLIDFKCTRDPREFTIPAILQLLGYAALDYADSHQISSVAIYHARAAGLVDWPLSQYLPLLGSRLDLLELRAQCAKLCGLVPAYRLPVSNNEEKKLARVLRKLGVPAPDICRGCARQVVVGGGVGTRRYYCSLRCRNEVRNAAMTVLMQPKQDVLAVDLQHMSFPVSKRRQVTFIETKASRHQSRPQRRTDREV